MKMDRIRRSFRKKKDHVPECSKPHQWQEDEKKVRDGSCSFQVRYLGCIEVLESRGMQVCEDAVKALKAQCRGKYQRAILYVSGEALRVVDEISKSMIVDQTIEKVSFCAPDRNHDKGFSYICRDGTTRRWICHGFLAVKESGERLSHAVGCAFAICLERKQKRNKESGVSVSFNQDKTSFTRMGSFRQTSITERIADPQSAIVPEPVPVKQVENPFAVNRPRATPSLLHRQGSFRGFEKLQEGSSPFKRSVSLRLNELPSTLQRQHAMESPTQPAIKGAVSPIQELSPSKENEESIAQMCQQLTQGLTALNTDDPFANVARNAQAEQGYNRAGIEEYQRRLAQQQMAANQRISPSSGAAQMVNNNQVYPSDQGGPRAMPQTNPWETGQSRDDFWQHKSAVRSPTSSTNPFVAEPSMNGTVFKTANQTTVQAQPRTQFQHTRSHSIDTGELSTVSWHQQQQRRKPTLLEMSHQQRSFQNGDHAKWQDQPSSTRNATSPPRGAPGASGVDPFDVAWAAKTANKQNTNPFSSSKTVKTYEVQL